MANKQKENEMKTFTIKKKRDGQDWEVLGEMLARDWQDAKREFVNRCKNDHDIRFVDVDNIDDDEREVYADIEKWYFQKGLYLFDETGGMYPEFIASGVFDTLRYDVYTWTICRV
jgi:hypothetical protein